MSGNSEKKGSGKTRDRRNGQTSKSKVSGKPGRNDRKPGGKAQQQAHAPALASGLGRTAGAATDGWGIPSSFPAGGGPAAGERSRAIGAQKKRKRSATKSSGLTGGSSAKRLSTEAVQSGSKGRGKGRERAAAAAADTLPVVVNEEYIAEVIGLGHDGEGVGRVDGFTLFIPGALPDEKVRVKVLKVKKQFGYAKLLEIVSGSKERVSPPCPIYKHCGGCQLQHLSYEAQLRYKRQQVVDSLERIGKLKVAGLPERTWGTRDTQDVQSEDKPSHDQPLLDKRLPLGDRDIQAETLVERMRNTEGVVVHETLGMTEPWRYRNKAQVPIGFGEEGGLVGGFYKQGTHQIIDMEACLIQHESNDEVVTAVKKVARELGIRPYNEATHQGLLRHVVVRSGYHTGEIMVVLVTNGLSIPHMDELVGLIRRDIPGVTSICQNMNTARTNVIFGDRTEVLWGRDVIYDTIGDIRFAISARSFYQVNPQQTEVLYTKALEYARLTGTETVIDAYCGIGSISLFLAQAAGKVYGVEIVPEAIEDAKRNAALNGIANAEFEAGLAEVVIPRWREEGIVADVIVVDPPRKGCDAVLLETIVAMRPQRVVYVSCNPTTLARDLRVLEDGGYRTVEVQPVDMFPQTVHVECLLLLIRKERRDVTVSTKPPCKNSVRKMYSSL